MEKFKEFKPFKQASDDVINAQQDNQEFKPF
jgi:hypothetical protein